MEGEAWPGVFGWVEGEEADHSRGQVYLQKAQNPPESWTCPLFILLRSKLTRERRVSLGKLAKISGGGEQGVPCCRQDPEGPRLV